MRNRKQLLILAAAIAPAFSQTFTATSLAPNPNLQFFDTSSGQSLPCVNCTLSTYSAGTSTPLATYTDSTGTSQNPTVITLSSLGYTTSGIWIGASCYKFVLANALGSTVWTQDHICDNAQLLKASLSGTAGASSVGFQPTGGSSPTTVGAALNAAFLYDIGFDTAAHACASTKTVAVTSSALWSNLSTLSCSAPLWFPTGTGVSIQPASLQTVTVPCPTAPSNQIFDIHLGGAVSISTGCAGGINPAWWGLTAAATGTTSVCGANSAAMVAALNAAAALGSQTVVLPGGNYPSSHIVMNAPQTAPTTSGFGPNRTILTGTGILQSCAAEPLLEIDGQYGFEIAGIGLDGNNLLGTNGLFLSVANSVPMGNVSVHDMRINEFSGAGITLDDTQNSVLFNLDLLKNTTSMEIANSAGGLKMDRIEFQGGIYSLKSLLVDVNASLPGYALSGNNPPGNITIDSGLFECNSTNLCSTAPGNIPVYIDGGYNIHINYSFIGTYGNTSQVAAPEVIYLGTHATGIVFEDDEISNDHFDQITVNNASTDSSTYGPNTLKRVQLNLGAGTRACTQPAIQSSGLIVLSEMAQTNPPSCLSFASTDATPANQRVQYFPVAMSGANNAFPLPAQSIGPFFFSSYGTPTWWNGPLSGGVFVDAYGNPTTSTSPIVRTGSGAPSAGTGNPGDAYLNGASLGSGPSLWTRNNPSTPYWTGIWPNHFFQTGAGSPQTITQTLSDVTNATVTLDQKGVWDLEGYFQVLCANPDLCQMSMNIGGSSGVVTAAVQTTASGSTEQNTPLEYIYTAGSAPVIVKLQIQNIAGSNTGSSTVLARLIAKLLAATP